MAAKLVLLAVPAGTALAFNPWGYNLFIVPKLYWLAGLTLMAMVLALLYWALNGQLYLPSGIFLLLPALVLAWLGLATIMSVLPQISLVGKMPRYEGLLSWFLYFALFFLSFALFGDAVDRNRLHWAVLATALIAAVYGILQAFGLDFVRWDPTFAADRIRSTFGNASTFGAYLALVLPFLAVNLKEKPQVSSRTALAFVLPTGAAAMALTASRGAWLGLSVAAVYAAARLLRRPGGRLSGGRRVALAFGLVVVIAGGLFVSSSIEFKRGTAAGRLILWKQTVKAIADRPVLGWGLETFQYIFPRYISAEYEEKVTRKTTIDNAHSFFFTWVRAPVFPPQSFSPFCSRRYLLA